MASTTAPRRKSAGSGAAMSSGLGMTGTAGAAGGGAGAGTASAGAIGRARMDANLRMSSKTAKDDERMPMHHARNKSSERLHRLGGGSSSQQLAHTKRSKSYSQIAHATAAAPSQANGASATRKAAKLRRGRSEGHAGKADADGKDADEDDGWTSADQTAEDVEGSAQAGKDSDDSDGEDGALTFGRRNDKGKQSTAAKTTQAPSTQSEQASNAAGRAQLDAPLSRDTVDAASDKTPLARPVALPKQDDDLHADLGKTTSSEMVRQSSEDTLATDPTDHDQQRSVHSSENPAEPQDAQREPGKTIPRQKSTASVRTLTDTTAKDNHASPLSTSISNSTLSRKRTSFMPRNSSFYAAPPQLSTEYAIAGGRGSEPNSKSRMNRSSDSNLDSNFLTNTKTQHRSIDRSLDSTPAYRFSTIDPMNSSSSSSSDARRHHRRSSVSSTRSRSSIINLPGVTPSLGVISHDSVNAESTGAQTSRAIEAMQRASNGGLGDSSLIGSSQSAFTLPVRQRTMSTQSTTGSSEAARLASKLRMTRDASGDDYNATGSMSSTASRMLANSGSKFFSTIKSDGPTTRALARYNKPTVSVFVKRQDDFKTIEKIVEQGSLFDENFARANLATFSDHEDDEDDDEADQQGHAHQEHHRTKANRQTSKRQPSGRGRISLHVRYVMDFGLSGPAVERTPTTQALLSTCLDNDEYEATWAPALAQAAGLGGSATAQDASAYNPREEGGRAGNGEGSLSFPSAAFGRGGAGMDLVTGAAGGGEAVFINGPNATPLHFLHGLTNTNDSPFPLDEADVAPSSTALAAAYHDGHAGHPSHALGHGEYVDAKNLRAVALTWAALNTTKNHIVTRRYVDPMRESVERVMLAAGFGPNGGNSAGAGGTKQDWNESRWPVNASSGSQQQSQATSAQPYYGSGSGDALAGGGHQTPGRGVGTPGGSSRWGWRHLFAEQS